MHDSLTDILQAAGARKIAQFSGVGVVRTREHTGIVRGAETSRLTFYAVRSKVLIYAEYCDGAGWDVFIPASNGNDVEPTLAAVRAYLRDVTPQRTPHNMREHSQRVRTELHFQGEVHELTTGDEPPRPARDYGTGEV